ncbi:hypothetical protein F2Q68_00020208 [Brassica cretica]|uniref:Uncharacterized protein n=1 Tax=Brassica cretica TaxID=69181 RepID=A0A8S9FUN2_BRACR|nr:hypothetical protein F2Q68_00020208 [Brassica cretica]
MLNKIMRSIEDDCCSVILKEYSEDFLEVFQSVRLRKRLPGSLTDDLILRRRLPGSFPEYLKPRIVELRRGSVTIGVIGDYIFSDYDCCSVILKEYSEDFLEVFESVRLRKRLPGSLTDDFILRRRLPGSFPEWFISSEIPDENSEEHFVETSEVNSEEVLPRYIPRSFPTNWWSSLFPRKFVSSEFRRKIPRDFRGKKNFRGVISEDLFRRFRRLPCKSSRLPYLIPRLVELRRGSVTTGVVGNHIFSDYDCCSVILKDNSDDFQEVFYEVLHSERLPGSLPDDLRLRRRLLGSLPECCLVPESLEGAWVKGSRDCRFLGWRMDFTFELWIAQRLFMLLLRHRGVLLDV